MGTQSEDLGPWNPDHEALFLDLTTKKICKQIKFFYRRTCPSAFEQGDDTIKRTTGYLRVFQSSQLSIRDTLLQYPQPSSRKNAPVDMEMIKQLEPSCKMMDPNRSTVWYDKDGQKLVHYFPHMINPKTQTNLIQVFQDLIKVYTPAKPSELEMQSTQYEEWKERLGENTKFGVIPLTYHYQQGQSHASPAADFLERTWDETTAAIEFRKSDAIQNIATFVSVLFAAIDPPTWRRYREVYRLTASRIRLIREYDPEQSHCFVGQHLLINMFTTPHYNVTDPPKGWVAMVVVGHYTDGNLVIPHLGIVIPYQSGDIVFIRAWMLLHFINEYRGSERYVIVFSTCYSIFEWLQKTF